MRRREKERQRERQREEAYYDLESLSRHSGRVQDSSHVDYLGLAGHWRNFADPFRPQRVDDRALGIRDWH